MPTMTPYKHTARISKATITLVIDDTTDINAIYALAAQSALEHFRATLNKLPISDKYRREIWRTLDGTTVTPRDLGKCLAQAMSTMPILNIDTP